MTSFLAKKVPAGVGFVSTATSNSLPLLGATCSRGEVGFDSSRYFGRSRGFESSTLVDDRGVASEDEPPDCSLAARKLPMTPSFEELFMLGTELPRSCDEGREFSLGLSSSTGFASNFPKLLLNGPRGLIPGKGFRSNTGASSVFGAGGSNASTFVFFFTFLSDLPSNCCASCFAWFLFASLLS